MQRPITFAKFHEIAGYVKQNNVKNPLKIKKKIYDEFISSPTHADTYIFCTLYKTKHELIIICLHPLSKIPCISNENWL